MTLYKLYRLCTPHNQKHERKIEKRKYFLFKRHRKLNKNFIWTNEAKEKIRLLNDQLLLRYREAYDEVNRLKEEFDERFAQGDENYRDYEIKVEFWYNHEPCNSKDKEELWADLCEFSFTMGPAFHRSCENSIPSFEEELLIGTHIKNEYPFNSPELADVQIHDFMRDIFNYNHTYSLEEAVQMKAGNFSWLVKICLEHWADFLQ